eukprot:g1746.t1
MISQRKEETKKLSDANADEYDAIFFVGGFGTMWDFPMNEDVQAITKSMYENGKIVAAVCHGPCALVNVKLSSGEYLVKGCEVTAFSNEEEDAVSRRSIVPWTNEDKLASRGATYKSTSAWGEHVCVSGDKGRLITGQNPASAKKTAQEVISAIKKIKLA